MIIISMVPYPSLFVLFLAFLPLYLQYVANLYIVLRTHENVDHSILQNSINPSKILLDIVCYYKCWPSMILKNVYSKTWIHTYLNWMWSRGISKSALLYDFLSSRLFCWWLYVQTFDACFTLFLCCSLKCL